MIHALHGNFGLPSDWDRAIPPGVTAKAWHLWEIRRQHPEARTLTGFATWFNNQIEALPPDASRLLAGYSLGGRLALHVLLDRPALWHRALLLSTHPGLSHAADRTARLAHDRQWHTKTLTDPWPDLIASWKSQPLLTNSSPITESTAGAEWRQEIASAFDDWSLGQQDHLPPALSLTGCTGLWLTGSQDHKFSALASAALITLPRFRRQLVPAANHSLLRDHPTAIHAALQSLQA